MPISELAKKQRTPSEANTGEAGSQRSKSPRRPQLPWRCPPWWPWETKPKAPPTGQVWQESAAESQVLEDSTRKKIAPSPCKKEYKKTYLGDGVGDFLWESVVATGPMLKLGVWIYTVQLVKKISRIYLKVGAGEWCSRVPGGSRNTFSKGIRLSSWPLGALTVKAPSNVSLK